MLSEPTPVAARYLAIGDLAMYVEFHGLAERQGPPLVLLHGGMMTFGASFARVLPGLVPRYRVIGLEQQGHGHTADLDRPLRFAQTVQDTIAAFEQLALGPADLWGFSDGAILALGLAIARPDLVRSLTLNGVNYTNDGLQPGLLEFFRSATADDFVPEMAAAYAAVAPDPGQWSAHVARVLDQAATFPGWADDDLRRITAPVLIIGGDEDIATVEHFVDLYRLLPHAQLAILPGTDHAAQLLGDQAAWSLAMFDAFQARIAAGWPGSAG